MPNNTTRDFSAELFFTFFALTCIVVIPVFEKYHETYLTTSITCVILASGTALFYVYRLMPPSLPQSQNPRLLSVLGTAFQILYLGFVGVLFYFGPSWAIGLAFLNFLNMRSIKATLAEPAILRDKPIDSRSPISIAVRYWIPIQFVCLYLGYFFDQLSFTGSRILVQTLFIVAAFIPVVILMHYLRELKGKPAAEDAGFRCSR